jgi:hypothetical protein
MSIQPQQRFGRLTAIHPSGSSQGRIVWKCVCDCGNEAFVKSKHLNSGGSRSCGCLRSEVVRALRAKEATAFDDRLLNTATGCQEWQGARDRRGYGTMRRGKRDRKAHRFAYERAFGPIPPGMVVCHRCDNPPCCNPEHLFLGTNAQNTADCVSKGRQARGAKNANAKVTDHIVRQIRRLCSEGMTQDAVAAMFGIAQTTVSKIVIHKSWAHVND